MKIILVETFNYKSYSFQAQRNIKTVTISENKQNEYYVWLTYNYINYVNLKWNRKYIFVFHFQILLNKIYEIYCINLIRFFHDN